MRRRFIQTQGGIDLNNYLTIEALEDGLTVKLTRGLSVYYCVNGSGKWELLSIGIETSPINNGDTISFKDGDGLIRFSISKRCNLLGTIMSIAYGDYWTENSVAPLSTGMFSGCTTIVSVDENFLPATTLSENCYYALFESCTSLVNAPVLPATTLSLNCYNYIFKGCNNLNYIKALFTTTPKEYYTDSWVYDVASTGTFVKNPDATWDVVGVNGVPSGWTVKFDGEEDVSEFYCRCVTYHPRTGAIMYDETFTFVFTGTKTFGDCVGLSDISNTATIKQFVMPSGDYSIFVSVYDEPDDKKYLPVVAVAPMLSENIEPNKTYQFEN